MRYSIRGILWLTLVVALVAGWIVDYRRLTTAPPVVPPVVSIPIVVNRNPYNERVTGYNANGLPTFTGPRGGQYHYSADGGKVYDKRSKITPVDELGI